MARPMAMLAAVALLALTRCASAQLVEDPPITTKSGMVIDLVEQMNVGLQLTPDAKLCIGVPAATGLASNTQGPKLVVSIPCTGVESDIELWDLEKIVIKENVTVYWQVKPAGDEDNCLTASPPKLGVSSLSITPCSETNLAQQFGIYNITKVQGAFTIRVRPGGIAKTTADQCVSFGGSFGSPAAAGGKCKDAVVITAGSSKSSSSRVFFSTSLAKMDNREIILKTVGDPNTCVTAPADPPATPPFASTYDPNINACGSDPALEVFKLIRSSGKRYYQLKVLNDDRCLGVQHTDVDGDGRIDFKRWQNGARLFIVPCNNNDDSQEFGFYRFKRSTPAEFLGSYQVRIRNKKKCLQPFGDLLPTGDGGAFDFTVGQQSCNRKNVTQAWFLE